MKIGDSLVVCQRTLKNSYKVSNIRIWICVFVCSDYACLLMYPKRIAPSEATNRILDRMDEKIGNDRQLFAEYLLESVWSRQSRELVPPFSLVDIMLIKLTLCIALRAFIVPEWAILYHSYLAYRSKWNRRTEILWSFFLVYVPFLLHVPAEVVSH